MANTPRRKKYLWNLRTGSTLALAIVPGALLAQGPVQQASFTPPVFKTSTALKQDTAQQPPQPFGAGTQQAPTPSPSETTGGVSNELLSTFGSSQAPRQQETVASPGTNNVSTAAESSSRASTDVGDFLAKSEEALGFEVQRRSPIVTDPHIRGYRAGQLVTYLDGGWAYPARLDLDTIVSKIDSSNIRDVVVIKGPYSVRYGSGFSFLDIATNAPPRYDCGFENHGQIISGYKTNGQPVHEAADHWFCNRK